MIDGHGQSHGDIVPKKSPNNSQKAEGMEERSPVKGNVHKHPSHRTQSRIEEMQIGAVRIRIGNVAIPIRQYPRQEPDAANLLVRIRGGGSP